jgi:hypothetical protein
MSGIPNPEPEADGLNSTQRDHLIPSERVAAFGGEQHPLGAGEICHLADFHALLPE